MTARLGTLAGTLAPTLLSLLGAALFLRGGRIAGEAGALGAVVLVGSAFALAFATATSLAALLSNAREDAPSTLSALRSSQGPGVATAIGLPLWVARAAGASLGALAIAEGWQWMVPGQPQIVIAALALLAAAAAAWQARAWIGRAAPVVLGVVVVGLLSILLGPTGATAPAAFRVPDWDALWPLVVAGTAGTLVAPDPVVATREPRRAAPGLVGLGLGGLAWLVTLLWASSAAPPSVLLGSPTVLLDHAALPTLALVGLVAAGAWAAVAGIGDGARILRELVGDRVPWLERPGAPELVTLNGAVLAVLVLRSLDGVASWLAIATLLAWGAVCAVVAIEMGLGLSSFRPAVRPHRAVPVAGAAAAGLLMLIVDAGASVILAAAVVAAALWATRTLRTRELRSSIATALAQWAAERASDSAAVRAWKPALVVPVRSDDLRHALDLLCDLAAPEGSVRLLGVGREPALGDAVATATAGIGARGLVCAATTLTSEGEVDPVPLALEALRVAAFRPNLLVLQVPHDAADDAVVRRRVAAARATDVGVLLLGTPPRTPFVAARRTITLWIRNVPGEWDPLQGYEGRNLDLTLLLGYRLATRWGSELRLVTVVGEPDQRPSAERFLGALTALARLPRKTQRLVIVGTFEQAVEDLSNADLDVFGLQPDPDLAKARGLVERARSTCLFVLDSGRESALA